MPQACNNMAGHSNCAAAIVRTFLGKPNGCPGNGKCVCRYQGNPEADLDRAHVFQEDPVVAMRYVGHHKNERRKRTTLALIGA